MADKAKQKDPRKRLLTREFAGRPDGFDSLQLHHHTRSLAWATKLRPEVDLGSSVASRARRHEGLALRVAIARMLESTLAARLPGCGMLLRRFVASDAGRVWALNNLPNVGETADPNVPLDLPIANGPPTAFPYLADVQRHFVDSGGEFLVVEHDGHLVGMGGIRPDDAPQAEVLHIRVHPATRRQGVGRLLMNGLEARARALGFQQLHLDTATNQPEAVAFYRALGYIENGTESHPSWTWTLQYFTKSL